MSETSVELIDSMGNDLEIARAAWVSTGRTGTFQEIEKLLTYLAKHNHWTPFAHPQLSFEIKAPIFVARQLIRHTVGLVWNEESRRYIAGNIEYYIPKIWRRKSESLKQGSGDDFNEEDQKYFNDKYNELLKYVDNYYSDFIDRGMAPEQARIILPLSTMTNWRWTGSLYAFSRIFNLRSNHCSGPAQKETSEITDKIGEYIKNIFKISWKVLTQNQK